MGEDIQPRRRDEREGRREERGRNSAFAGFRSRDAGHLDEEIEALSYAVIGAAIEVHRVLGPGLPETVYRNALSRELTFREIPHIVEALVPVQYKGATVGEGRVDILVNGRLVVELKVVEQLTHVHQAQVIAYLSALRLQLGLLINFNVDVLRNGIVRRVL